MTAKLFVGRLSERVKEPELEDLFAKYGEIARIDLKTGFGFVEFRDSGAAENARRALDGMEVDGSVISVEPARSKGERKSDQVPGTGRCFRCGQTGHWARECQMVGDVCFKCGMEGHIAKDCNETSTTYNRDDVPNEDRSGRHPRGGDRRDDRGADRDVRHDRDRNADYYRDSRGGPPGGGGRFPPPYNGGADGRSPPYDSRRGYQGDYRDGYRDSYDSRAPNYERGYENRTFDTYGRTQEPPGYDARSEERDRYGHPSGGDPGYPAAYPGYDRMPPAYPSEGGWAPPPGSGGYRDGPGPVRGAGRDFDRNVYHPYSRDSRPRTSGGAYESHGREYTGKSRSPPRRDGVYPDGRGGGGGYPVAGEYLSPPRDGGAAGSYRARDGGRRRDDFRR